MRKRRTKATRRVKGGNPPSSLKHLEAAKAEMDQFGPNRALANDALMKWGKEVQRDTILHSFSGRAPALGQPDTMYILVNGRLRRYVLRTMPVYVQDDGPEAG